MRNAIASDQIRIFIDCKEPLPYAAMDEIIRSAIKALAGISQIPSDTRFTVAEIGQGSWWAHLLSIGGGVAAIHFGAVGLIAAVRNGEMPFADSIARSLDFFGGSKVVISTSEMEQVVERAEIPVAVSEIASLTMGSDLSATPSVGRPSIDNWHAYFNTPESDRIAEIGETVSELAKTVETGGFQADAFEGSGFQNGPRPYGEGQYGKGETDPPSSIDADDEMITLTRTSGEYARTRDGRRAEMIDGSRIMGTKTVPVRLVRFIDETPFENRNRIELQKALQMGGGIPVDLYGRFIKVAGSTELVFETKSAVFDVEFSELAGTRPPTDRTLIAIGRLNSQNPSEMLVEAWEMPVR